tara:strand:- start:7310 stop:8224 length:915 start_codon:yes stop_codon:yes gene_type:complete
MTWFKTIRKAPPPFKPSGVKYNLVQIADIPGAQKLFSPGYFPAEQYLPRGGSDVMVEVYQLPNNRFAPSLRSKNYHVGLVTILNIETGQVTYPWAKMRLQNDIMSPPTAMELRLGTGQEPLDLEDDEIGLMVHMRDGRIPKMKFAFEVYGYIPPASNFLETIEVPTGVEPMDFDLTNGAVAALLLFTQMTKPRESRRRKEEFAAFGLGELSKDTDSKYIKELTDKGLMRREAGHAQASMRNFPRPTPKGKAASNRFEMHHDEFYGEFKDLVRRNPDADFDSFSDQYRPDKGSGEGTGSFRTDLA